MRDAIIGLVGLPGSGAELVHRAMAAHPNMDGVLAPYERGWAAGYRTTGLAQFLANCKIAPDSARALIVTETTARPTNVRYLFELMASAQSSRIYVGLVLVLRCPFEAYLSHSEAPASGSETTERLASGFSAFAASTQQGLREVAASARRQHFRIVTYNRFLMAPGTELARLMALIPLRMEASQLTFAREPAERRGADAESSERRIRAAHADRAEPVVALIDEMRGQPGWELFQALRHLTAEEACRLPDATVLDHLAEIVLTRGG